MRKKLLQEWAASGVPPAQRQVWASVGGGGPPDRSPSAEPARSSGVCVPRWGKREAALSLRKRSASSGAAIARKEVQRPATEPRLAVLPALLPNPRRENQDPPGNPQRRRKLTP